MNTKQSRSGAFRRCLLLLPALIVGLGLAFTAAASAQTAVPFQASVNAIQPKATCPTTWCGTANIAGYGTATWTFSVTPGASVSSACPAYTATSTFTLVSDGSTLTLNENGLVCSPGNSFAPPKSSGDPLYTENSSWTVQAGTGQFSGMTGEGTDIGRTAGHRIDGTYTGTLLGP